MLYSMEKAAWIYFNVFGDLSGMEAIRKKFSIVELMHLYQSIKHYCGIDDEAARDVATAIENY